jgi:hypothetical protein
MERVKLRIRIPEIYPCITPECTEVSRNLYCIECRLDTGMREEMSATALPRQPKIIHRPSFSSDSSRLRKVY